MFSPNGEYILANEKSHSKLNQGEAEELRVEVKNAMKKTHLPTSNTTKEESEAIKELKRDDNRMILTADKGVTFVVIDKEDYIKKAELWNQPTYKKILDDTTNRQKNKCINVLKNTKAEGHINEETYKKMYSTGAGSPKL